ncbi:hypothetical protein [Luteimonas sp. MC1750]|uniref:hypothetical protein n=1 Tax=Luteimonas sp. MC1750 TaxID=2799326 RepID=UPI0018F0D674|nr:hypothetical protein [Luteimonas sp. MC1750]MBJ6985263.1 hypothetical protein [Luteimonas sp. MC1750]QQO05908.1 hypothetical protein JGR68_00125 [Luteimonas sp. MC1750]
MYRIVLACYGVPESAGPEAAADITAEFAEHRQWYKNVSCTWDGARLLLQGDNDVDADGLALIDEFSDCTSAYIKELFDGEVKVESIVQLPGEA